MKLNHLIFLIILSLFACKEIHYVWRCGELRIKIVNSDIQYVNGDTITIPIEITNLEPTSKDIYIGNAGITLESGSIYDSTIDIMIMSEPMFCMLGYTDNKITIDSIRIDPFQSIVRNLRMISCINKAFPSGWSMELDLRYRLEVMRNYEITDYDIISDNKVTIHVL